MIYAIFSHLNASAIIMLAWLMEKESQKIANLPVLATYWSDTLVILSSKLNGPVAHESTRLCLIWLMEAFN